MSGETLRQTEKERWRTRHRPYIISMRQTTSQTEKQRQTQANKYAYARTKTQEYRDGQPADDSDLITQARCVHCVSTTNIAYHIRRVQTSRRRAHTHRR